MAETSRILIVDDEPNVRLVFRTALESAGFAVTEARDGQEALRLIQGDKFGLVLLDLRMPGTDGMATLHLLRNKGIGVPVVVVSAHGSIPDVVAAMRLGVIDFIPKPLAPETLRRVVREAVVCGQGLLTQASPSRERLNHEAPARARQALERGECDDADFFLRVAAPLGVDPDAAGQLAHEIRERRRIRGLGAYRVVGGLTWG
jgi:DNA-binding NtrC family response regulator